jgi:hypothetical protein
MSKKRAKSAKDPAFQAELDEQVLRMRQMLKLMAPESGSMALGAMREAFPGTSLQDRVEAFKTYR